MAERMPPTTALPSMPFRLSLAEHTRALAGPPAYMVRRRAIEDARARLVARLRSRYAEAAYAAPEKQRGVLEDLAGERRFVEDLRAVNELIARHNRYYPIEANLPLDPRTGNMLDAGQPFQPMPALTLAMLFDEVRASR